MKSDGLCALLASLRPAEYNESVVTTFRAPKQTLMFRAGLVLVLAFAVGLVTIPRMTSEAQTPVYTLVAANWDGGGGRTTSGDYALESSIGQPDAGLQPANATGLTAGYTLEGGFQHMQLPLDTNCDDRVNATDALYQLRLLAGLQAQGPCSADANRDGSVSILDVWLIRTRVAGIVTPP